MKTNILKVVLGGVLCAALLTGVSIAVAPVAHQNADLVWPEN